MLKMVQDLYATFVKQDPIYYILYVTAACNARCKMCYYMEEIESAEVKTELTFDEICKISEKSGRLIQLSIGGGEPTLRKDLADICEVFAKNNGVRFITLPTNGINTAQVVDRVANIVKKCPDTHLRVSLSLDGHEALHDEIRQVPGNYRNLMDTLRQLKPLAKEHENLTVDFATVLQSHNQDTIKQLFRDVHDKFKPDNHMLMIARGNVKDPSVKNVDGNIYRETIQLKEALYSNKETRSFSPFIRAITLRSLDLIYNDYIHNQFQLPCVAGKRLVVISEKGEVKPCEILDKSFGNLRDHDYDMSKILKQAESRKTQDWIVSSKCHCTFECAMNISVLYDWKGYPDLVRRAAKLFFQANRNN